MYRAGPVEVQGAGDLMGMHDEANYPVPITVVGRVGTVGRPRFMPRGCWVNNNAAALIATQGNCMPEYLHLLLECLNWGALSTVTAQPFLSVRSLMSTSFPVPGLNEQSEIARIIFEMGAELRAIKQRRYKTWLLKQGMMQELLTGRTRLL